MFYQWSVIITTLLLFLSCASESPKQTSHKGLIIQKITEPIILNGGVDEAAWNKASWYPMDQYWIGAPTSKEDFSGRFKVLWSNDRLYVLAETTDDIIRDMHEDGLERYWDDDCLEIFIDENASGGDHQYNHNAFAYHIAHNLRVTDMGLDSLPAYFDHHLQSAKVTDNNITTWEIAIEVHTDDYSFGQKPRKLQAGEKIGFMIAYCDNDNSKEREHFIGSTKVEGEDKNRGWIDAGIFDKWTLVE